MPATILLYEANPDIRELVTGLLEAEGYAVMGTNSLREGEAVCRTVDLFLADCDEKTKEDAMAVFRRVCEAAGGDVPIVIFTTSGIVRQEAEDAGCADVIRKPFDIDELLRRVAENLRQPV
jgi:DNA-binding response OmpR family regulator